MILCQKYRRTFKEGRTQVRTSTHPSRMASASPSINLSRTIEDTPANKINRTSPGLLMFAVVSLPPNTTLDAFMLGCRNPQKHAWHSHVHVHARLQLIIIIYMVIISAYDTR